MSLKSKIQDRRVSSGDCGEVTEKTVFINRVAKVVKGGRRFSFSALMVVGDGRGNVGIGSGKAAEVPDAIRKGTDKARKSMVRVPIKGTTVPHDVVGKFGPCRVVIKPAAPGTGVIAGAVVRALVEAAGFKDIKTKCIGSNNPCNVLQAALAGLLSLREPNALVSVRGKSVEETGYKL